MSKLSFFITWIVTSWTDGNLTRTDQVLYYRKLAFRKKPRPFHAGMNGRAKLKLKQIFFGFAFFQRSHLFEPGQFTASPHKSMIPDIFYFKYQKDTAFALILLIPLALIAGSPLFVQGWFITHEETAPVERVLAIAHEIENGFIYPRWLSLSYFGIGSPFSNFYPPGFYLTAAYLHVAGFTAVTSIKIMSVAFFYLGSAGIFLWIRRHHGFYASFLSAVLYLFAPYHFADIYVRGAFAEFVAIGLTPFLFLGMDMAFSEKWFKGLALMSITTAALILFHTLSAVMIAPSAAIYFIYLALRSNTASVLRAAAGPVIGAGVSAFYWLPMMMEVGDLKQFDQAVIGDQYSVANHFVSFNQLYSRMWGYGYSMPGPDDGMSFQIGLCIISFLFLSAALFVFSRRKDLFPVMLLALGALAVFLTAEPSSRIYELVSPLQYVQFSWRFLGPATLFLAAFAGSGMHIIESWSKGPLRFVPTSILAAAIISVVAFSNDHRAVLADSGYVENSRNIGSLCVRDEYLPKGVSSPAEVWQFLGSFEGKVLANGADIKNIHLEGPNIDFDYNAQKQARATIASFFFPGWRVQLDGRAIQAQADGNGLLTFSLPAGSSHVSVRFEDTFARKAGWYVSAFTIAAFFLAAGSWKRSAKSRP